MPVGPDPINGADDGSSVATQATPPQDPTMQQASPSGAPSDNGLAATVASAMGPQSQPAQGSMSALGSGKGFFRGLLGTLLNGVAVAGSAAATAGTGTGSFQRAAGTAMQDPRLNPQARQQQMDAQTMDKLKLAMAQINLQQTYHMLLNSDRQLQTEGYQHGRSWAEDMIKSDNAEVMFTTPDRAAATARLSELKNTDKQNSMEYNVHPAPGSSPDRPEWAIIKVRPHGILNEDRTYTFPGNPDNGIAPFTWTARKGMTEKDAGLEWSQEIKNHYSLKIQANSTDKILDDFSKPGGIDSWVKADDAVKFATNTINDPKSSPAQKERARKVLADANQRKTELPTPREGADEKQGDKLSERIDRVNKSIDAARKPLDASVDNLNKALADLDNPNAVTDALGVIKTIVATSGGAGSGVRLTMPEITRLATARSWSEDVKAWFNKALNGETLTAKQRAQMKGAVQDVRDLVVKKQRVFDDIQSRIYGTHSNEEINALEREKIKRFNDIENQGTDSNPPQTTKAGSSGLSPTNPFK
jgi:predicted double-glycine peptidase